MKTIGNIEVSNKVFELIDENVSSVPNKPMQFYITSAVQKKIFKKIEEVTKWAEKLGAQVTVKENYNSHPVLEITDPVCAQLEKHLNVI